MHIPKYAVCLNRFILLFSSDGVEVLNSSEPGVVIVDALSPYTLYTVQIEACTQFGCTTSPLVAIQTLEGG